MSDLRFDPINQLWVAIARNRLQRPTEYVPIEQVEKQLLCPFCRGNEEETPQQLASVDADGNSLDEKDLNWSSRVFPNKFPSLSDTDPDATNGCGPYQRIGDAGWQEILVLSPRHIDTFSALNDTELDIGMRVCRDRHRFVSERSGIKHAMLFMNSRSAAGASLSHIHLQLIGSPVVSPAMKNRWIQQRNCLTETGKSLIATLAEWEMEQQARTFFSSDQFVAFCPFASRFPLQTYIVPQNPVGRFGNTSQEQLTELGRICRSVVAGMESILERPAYNILLHTPPVDADEELQSAWFVEIFPRLTCTAGFEWGTDTWVNPVSPETAAKRLRSIQNGGIE